jgi:hypothetical protein
MAILNHASPYLSIVQLIHFLKNGNIWPCQIWWDNQYTRLKEIHGGVRKGTFKNLGSKAKATLLAPEFVGGMGKG